MRTYRFSDYLLWALPLFVAYLIYSYTITLPLFLDDLPNFNVVYHIDGIEQWGGSPAFPYYRPMTFSVWKLSTLGSDLFPAAFLHNLNVMSFGLTGVILGRLVRRLSGPSSSEVIGLLTGIGFVIFPFSFQAVTLISALFHLTLILGIVLCLWAALNWLDERGGREMFILAIAAAIFGVFSHENGPLLFPILIAVIWIVYRRQWPSRQRLMPLLIGIGMVCCVYVVLRLIVPRSTGDDLTGFSENPDLAIAYLSQGMIYPLIAIARSAFGVSTFTQLRILTLGVVLTTTTWLMMWHWSRRAGEVAGLGLAWYMAAIFPSALFLPAGYVTGSPRLMLLSSAGAAIFWGVAFGTAHRRIGDRCTRWAPASLVAFGIIYLAVSIPFHFERRRDFLALRDYNAELVDIARKHTAAGSSLLIVNAPNYLGPTTQTQTFWTGAEAATYMLNGLDYGSYIWVNTGLRLDVTAIAHGATLRYENQDKLYSAHATFVDGPPLVDLVRQADVIVSTAFDGDDFWPVYVGGEDESARVADIRAEFPDIDARLEESAASIASNRRTVTVTTRWHLAEPQPIKLFIHVFCDGAFVAQSDGYVWGDLYPFSAWAAGETHSDTRQIRLPEAVNPACLTIKTGLYWEQTIERLRVIDLVSRDIPNDQSITIPLE